MKKAVVDIMLNTDEIRYIATPETEGIETNASSVVLNRISHVEPCNVLLRILFRCLRAVVRDDSAVARWTRNWRCRWRVKMIRSGYTFGEFTNRDEAIAAEIEYYNAVESFGPSGWVLFLPADFELTIIGGGGAGGSCPVTGAAGERPAVGEIVCLACNEDETESV